jgi:hypothetical protein
MFYISEFHEIITRPKIIRSCGVLKPRRDKLEFM